MTKHVKGQADHLELGTWNAVCFECGSKKKAADMRKHWQGYWVCPKHWEPRQPQDFVKATTDDQTVPWSQLPSDTFIPLTNTFAPPDPVPVGATYLTTQSSLSLTTESGDFLITDTGVFPPTS